MCRYSLTQQASQPPWWISTHTRHPNRWPRCTRQTWATTSSTISSRTRWPVELDNSRSASRSSCEPKTYHFHHPEPGIRVEERQEGGGQEAVRLICQQEGEGEGGEGCWEHQEGGAAQGGVPEAQRGGGVEEGDIECQPKAGRVQGQEGHQQDEGVHSAQEGGWCLNVIFLY